MKIALIDDKKYGIKQIENSIPKNINYNFYYFPSYKDAVNKTFDIIFLDYYLDKDGVTGKDIIDLLDGDIIIGFSSVSSCNNVLISKGADFAVDKIKSDSNGQLEKLLAKILKNRY